MNLWSGFYSIESMEPSRKRIILSFFCKPPNTTFTPSIPVCRDHLLQYWFEATMSAFIPLFNTLRSRQNVRRFTDDTFKRIFVNENVRISIKISLKCVHKGSVNNIAALVQIMAWRRPGGFFCTFYGIDILKTKQWQQTPILFYFWHEIQNSTAVFSWMLMLSYLHRTIFTFHWASLYRAAHGADRICFRGRMVFNKNASVSTDDPSGACLCSLHHLITIIIEPFTTSLHSPNDRLAVIILQGIAGKLWKRNDSNFPNSHDLVMNCSLPRIHCSCSNHQDIFGQVDHTGGDQPIGWPDNGLKL